MEKKFETSLEKVFIVKVNDNCYVLAMDIEGGQVWVEMPEGHKSSFESFDEASRAADSIESVTWVKGNETAKASLE